MEFSILNLLLVLLAAWLGGVLAVRLGYPSVLGELAAGIVFALTPNPEINVLIVQSARERFFVPELHALLAREDDGALFRILEELGAHPLAVQPIDLSSWERSLADDRAREVSWQVEESGATRLREQLARPSTLPLAVRRGGAVYPYIRAGELEPGDEVVGFELAPA